MLVECNVGGHKKTRDIKYEKQNEYYLPIMLNGNLPTPQNLPMSGAWSSRPSYTANQSYGQCSAPDPISRIGQVMMFSHLLKKNIYIQPENIKHDTLHHQLSIALLNIIW